MRTIALYLATLVAGMFPTMAADCGHDCTTTIVVTGCNDAPVKGVEVELTLGCQSEHVKQKTDREGKAIFNGVCWKDITEKRINGLIERKVEGGQSQSDKDVTVKVYICGRS